MSAISHRKTVVSSVNQPNMSSVFIVGYTGATGQAIVRELARANPFKSIVLIGRRQADLPVTNDGRFVQKVVDFENLEANDEAFKGCDVGLCCLGTTRGQAGVAGFVRVDKDYVLGSARVAKSVGCKHFQVITASTSSKNSCLLYNRIKGEVEEELKAMKFDRLSIFRPALILDRPEMRFGERVAECLMFPCIKCCPTMLSVSVHKIAKGMINNVSTEFLHNVEVIDNAAIHGLAE